MGTDCKLNGESLDRWYVFSDYGDGFVSGKEYTKEEAGELIAKLKTKVIEHTDPEYHLFWLNKAHEQLQDKNIFYADYDDQYYD